MSERRGRAGIFGGLLFGVALALLVACQPNAEACCRSDGDCAPGASCFEGMCVLHCTDDSQCLEGERCLAGGVCAALGRPKGHCSFAFGQVPEADAGAPFDAGPDAGPELETCEDRHEPNDSPEDAAEAFAPVERLGICVADHDYFAVDAEVGDTVAARIEFHHADGDLDLELLLDGEQVAVSQGVSDVEQIEHVVTRAGRYVAHAFAFSDRVETRYELAFSRIPWVPCTDAYEPNDDPWSNPWFIMLPNTIEATTCAEDIDFFHLGLPDGQLSFWYTFDADPAVTATLLDWDGFEIAELLPGVTARIELSMEDASSQPRIVVETDSFVHRPYRIELTY